MLIKTNRKRDLSRTTTRQEKIVFQERWSFQTGWFYMDSIGRKKYSQMGKGSFQTGWSFQISSFQTGFTVIRKIVLTYLNTTCATFFTSLISKLYRPKITHSSSHCMLSAYKVSLNSDVEFRLSHAYCQKQWYPSWETSQNAAQNGLTKKVYSTYLNQSDVLSEKSLMRGSSI